MKIGIDSSLAPLELRDAGSAQGLLDKLSDKKYGYGSAPKYERSVNQSLFPIDHALEGTVFHSNLMGCMEKAWGAHRGVVITPDAIWFTLLSEVAGIVKDDPEFHRDLFTTKPDKTEIIVPGREILNLDLVIEALREHVPSDIDMFLPTFSTSTRASAGAFMAAFADAVSPYYSYGMLGCGIPFVDLLGTAEDWLRVREIWHSITDALSPKYDVFYGKVYGILGRIVGQVSEPSSGFWKEMFYLEKCGSGSDTEAYGWFTDLFREQPLHVRKVSNFATHIANVVAKQLETGKNYYMKQGMLSSINSDGALSPQFGHIVYREDEPTVTVEARVLNSIIVLPADKPHKTISLPVTEEIGDWIINQEALKKVSVSP